MKQKKNPIKNQAKGVHCVVGIPSANGIKKLTGFAWLAAIGITSHQSHGVVWDSGFGFWGFGLGFLVFRF